MRGLKGKIEREKRKIAELERLYKEKLAGTAQKVPEESPGEKKSLWDRLF